MAKLEAGTRIVFYHASVRRLYLKSQNDRNCVPEEFLSTSLWKLQEYYAAEREILRKEGCRLHLPADPLWGLDELGPFLVEKKAVAGGWEMTMTREWTGHKYSFAQFWHKYIEGLSYSAEGNCKMAIGALVRYEGGNIVVKLDDTVAGVITAFSPDPAKSGAIECPLTTLAVTERGVRWDSLEDYERKGKKVPDKKEVVMHQRMKAKEAKKVVDLCDGEELQATGQEAPAAAAAAALTGLAAAAAPPVGGAAAALAGLGAASALEKLRESVQSAATAIDARAPADVLEKLRAKVSCGRDAWVDKELKRKLDEFAASREDGIFDKREERQKLSEHFAEMEEAIAATAEARCAAKAAEKRARKALRV
ncbi:MAG: hypothetical protein CMI16_12820 [Opitutaceae bacterium]|nr:hypothetical protein [Opitutaceae bacterium]